MFLGYHLPNGDKKKKFRTMKKWMHIYGFSDLILVEPISLAGDLCLA